MVRVGASLNGFVERVGASLDALELWWMCWNFTDGGQASLNVLELHVDAYVKL